MKLLYCFIDNLMLQDVIWGMLENGVKLHIYHKSLDVFVSGEELEQNVRELEQMVKQEKCDGILSWNYSAIASIACERLGIPYISWIFDSPYLAVYSDSMYNSCNHMFIFDKKFYEDIKSKGVKCYYLPLAVNSTRLGAMNITDEQIKRFSSEVSFVGSLYTKNAYNMAISDYTKEVIEKHESVFTKQYGNWKENYLYTDITEDDIDYMHKNTTIKGFEFFPYASKHNIYVGYLLARKMAEYERARMLNELASHSRVTLYNSKDDHSMLENVICKPETNYEQETPIVYFSSKINLNITLRSIETGLPLRVFDIMGVGGFLMSNYQQEFEELYTPGKDVVLYSSMDELIDKTKFYLTHERERLTIAMNGYKRTISEHTMKIRAAQMLKTVFGNKGLQ